MNKFIKKTKKLFLSLLIFTVFFYSNFFPKGAVYADGSIFDQLGGFLGFSQQPTVACQSFPSTTTGSKQVNFTISNGLATGNIDSTQFNVDYPFLLYLDSLTTDTSQLANNLPQAGASSLRISGSNVDFTDYNNYIQYLSNPAKFKNDHSDQIYGQSLEMIIPQWQQTYDGTATVQMDVTLTNPSTVITTYPTINIPGFQGALAKYYLQNLYSDLTHNYSDQDFVKIFNPSNHPYLNNQSPSGQDLFSPSSGVTSHTTYTNVSATACTSSSNQRTSQDDIQMSELVNSIPLSYGYNCNGLTGDKLTSCKNTTSLSQNISAISIKNLTLSGLSSILATAWSSEQGINNVSVTPICHSNAIVETVGINALVNNSANQGVCIAFICIGQGQNISYSTTFDFNWVGNLMYMAYLNTQRYSLNELSPLDGGGDSAGISNYEHYCQPQECDPMAQYLVSQGVLDPNDSIVSKVIPQSNTNACNSSVQPPTPSTGGNGGINDTGGSSGGAAVIDHYPSLDVLNGTAIFEIPQQLQTFLIQVSNFTHVPPAVIAAIYNRETTLEIPDPSIDLSANLPDTSLAADPNFNPQFPTDTKALFEKDGNCGNLNFVSNSYLVDLSSLLSSNFTIPSSCGVGPGQITGSSNWGYALGEGNSDYIKKYLNLTMDASGSIPKGIPGYTGNYDTSVILSSLFMLNKAGYNIDGKDNPTQWTPSILYTMAHGYGPPSQMPAYANLMVYTASVYQKKYFDGISGVKYSYNYNAQ